MEQQDSVDRRLGNEREHMSNLVAASGGHLSLDVDPDRRRYTVRFHGIRGPVLHGDHVRIVDQHTLTIHLPDGFPAQAPLLRFNDPLVVPNCWASGVPCLVTHVWNAEMHLDEVVCEALDLIQNVAPNLESIANHEAKRVWDDPVQAATLRAAIGEPFRMAPRPFGAPTRSGIKTVTVTASGPGVSTDHAEVIRTPAVVGTDTTRAGATGIRTIGIG
jgi:ubiquitin-protein ligase